MANLPEEVSHRRRRVSYEQLERLWEYLNGHRDLAVGYNKTAQARDYSKRMWMSVSETLNSLGEGATKDWKGWSSYWVDYKAKLKRRISAIRISQNRTGGGPSEAIPLNELENKFASLLGEGFGTGLPNIQVDPFPTLTQHVHAEPEAGPTHPQIIIQPPLDHEYINIHIPDCPRPEHDGVPLEEVVPQVVRHHALALPVEVQPQVEAPQALEVQGHMPRRRRRQPMTQQMAREALVEMSRSRLLLEQQQMEIWKQMLETLNRIAAGLEIILRSRGQETRDEGTSDR